MKIKTNIHAGQQRKWAEKFYKCLQDTADINNKIEALQQRLYAPVGTQTTTWSSSYYPDQSTYRA